MNMEKNKKVFCANCRIESEFYLTNRSVVKVIRDKEYTFNITVALCKQCDEEVSIPGVFDLNAKEIDEQYRKSEGIVTVDEIDNLMKLYNIGKEPLSATLGFGTVTIPRYMEGQVPSKEYSDIIKSALSSPKYMKSCLIKNRHKITDAAYKKAMIATDYLINVFNVSDKMLQIISYIFDRLDEVTPLMLQKILYYSQGISYAVQGKALFNEDCEAWVHGPVYPDVYALFKDFKYSPIDDVKFNVVKNSNYELSKDNKNILDLVLDTFGIYGGKTLEKITHEERPWITARNGYGDNVSSNEIISKDAINDYFTMIDKSYNLNSKKGIEQYIHDILQKT